MSTRSVAIRVFISLWLIFSAHWATDFVREHFLVLSIVDRHTFALDGFQDLHPDIFVFENGHAYHGANPGISMIGAVPYFVLSPLVDRIVGRELSARDESAGTEPEYNDPRRMRREFYEKVRERGLDVRFGLIGLITEVFAMAPLSALGGAVFFLVLTGAGLARPTALGGTILYALGTPVFLRSGYLNQNLAVGIFGFIGFALLWNPGSWCSWSRRTRIVLAGLCGGLALLCDYSGGLLLALLGLYALVTLRDEEPWPKAVRSSMWYAAGAAAPIMLLWYYQWAAFGFPFYPPQNYMPPVQWSDVGYQGVGGPQLDLAGLLLFDPRFGLFTNAPVVLLAVAAPWLARRSSTVLARREALFCLAVGLAYIVFFSMVQYTRLQFNTGFRYLAPLLAFLTLAAIPALLRLPRLIAYAIVFVSVAINWALALNRFKAQESNVLEVVAHAYLGGLQLPALATLSRMSAADYIPGVTGVSSGMALFFLLVLLVAVWAIRDPWKPFRAGEPSGGS